MALQDKQSRASFVERISRARRHSTLMAYEGKWHDSGTGTISLASFLWVSQSLNWPTFLWFFEEKQLAPIIITCYSSVISDIFCHHGKCDINHDKDLSDLLATLELIDSYLSPCFQTESVLGSNMAQFRQCWIFSPQFVKLLSCKSGFLIVSSSACRVNELPVFSSDPNYLQFSSDRSVVLLT